MTISLPEAVIPTGVTGLDEVLRGGVPQGHLYLIEGDPGAGKTTLGLQFLLEGKRCGERTLWLSLSDTAAQIRGTAASHGWDLSGIELHNLMQSRDGRSDSSYTFFSPADVEGTDIIQAVFKITDEVQPTRVVFDPFSDVKLLARDPLRYRRQLLELREYFTRIGCTAFLIQEQIPDATQRDPSAESVVQGILSLHQSAPDFGRQRRRLRIQKMRGVDFSGGFHDVAIKTGGLQVYPRLVAADHADRAIREEVSSGIPDLDKLIGGGLERGASLLLLGPAGIGKSTLSNHMAVAAVERGERAAIYLFDETERAFISRNHGMGLEVKSHMASGRLRVCQMNPAEFTPGEFAHTIRQAVEEDQIQIVVIDSLNGYLNGMPDERHLSMHLHELLTYLSHRNVLIVLTLNQHGFMGESVHSPVDVSYLADAALLLRYFELNGVIRRLAIMMKRRCGPHEVQIHELLIDGTGVRLGTALTEYRGILTGLPDLVGDPSGNQPCGSKVTEAGRG